MLGIPLAALATVLALIACAPRALAGDFLWGVNGHPLVSYPGVTFEQQLDMMRALGLKSYRVDVVDMRHADKLAKLVEAAKARDIQILPVITTGIDLAKGTPEEIYARAYAIARDLVGRFGRDIRVWELGNEMENFAILKPCETRDDGTQYPCNWGPAGGVGTDEYFTPRWRKVSAALKGLSDATVSVDPGIVKAMGTAGWGHVGAFDRMKADGIRWDISVWHLYGDEPEWALRHFARHGKPIWVTEFNNPYGSLNGEVQQAEGLRHAMARLLHLSPKYRIEAAHIYELLDESYWGTDFEAVMGLVRLQRTPDGNWSAAGAKPSYHVVRKIVRVVDSDVLAVLGAKRLGNGPVSKVAAAPNRCSPASIAAATTPTAGRIMYAYCLLLDRPVDGGGLAAWQAELQRGMTMATLLQAMIASKEFQKRHGVQVISDSEFAKTLSRVLLGREATGPTTLGPGQGPVATKDGRAAIVAYLLGSTAFHDRHPLLAAP